VIDLGCKDGNDIQSNLVVLKNNINEIKKKVEDYILVLISDDEISF